jgi:DNA-binding PadR family transcriptional regulator
MAKIMIHDFLLGFIKIYILHYASQEPIFGKEFHDQLLKKGFDISYGTLYPIFHKFEKKGYLKHEDRNVNGKIRKYYSITREGKKSLNEAKLKARELFEELYEG